MSTIPQPPPPPVTLPELMKLSLEQYHRMGETGVLTPDDRVELLDGLLVTKPMKKPTHTASTELTRIALAAVIPPGWYVRVQEPVTLDDSEPEPDLALASGTPRANLMRHPTPAEVALVVEVADTSLGRDRDWKKRIYARNSVPTYWIVNLIDQVLEVYTDPSGPVLTPDYATATFLRSGDRADVPLGGSISGTVAVADLLP